MCSRFVRKLPNDADKRIGRVFIVELDPEESRSRPRAVDKLQVDPHVTPSNKSTFKTFAADHEGNAGRAYMCALFMCGWVSKIAVEPRSIELIINA